MPLQDFTRSAFDYGRNRESSVLEGFTLSPLPYPVLLFLPVLFVFLAISSYFSYEEAVESAEDGNRSGGTGEGADGGGGVEIRLVILYPIDLELV
ncbi:putative transmembrane protein [Senna tora]|uniref:Putative transmembrane protein n=1 Tax=Senna tora TaxID=362788 RepID=A0A834WDX9_9FABA|nr:putative transmembrane protein [Senna tora]